MRMSSETADDTDSSSFVGETERLLLERKMRQDQGLVQEIGRTVKNDGWDGVRSVVWGVYFAAQNFVFPTLAVALFALTVMNMAGYGYYIGDDGFQIDSLSHINQVRVLEAETARLAAETTMMR